MRNEDIVSMYVRKHSMDNGVFVGIVTVAEYDEYTYSYDLYDDGTGELTESYVGSTDFPDPLSPLNVELRQFVDRHFVDPWVNVIVLTKDCHLWKLLCGAIEEWERQIADGEI